MKELLSLVSFDVLTNESQDAEVFDWHSLPMVDQSAWANRFKKYICSRPKRVDG